MKTKGNKVSQLETLESLLCVTTLEQEEKAMNDTKKLFNDMQRKHNKIKESKIKGEVKNMLKNNEVNKNNETMINTDGVADITYLKDYTQEDKNTNLGIIDTQKEIEKLIEKIEKYSKFSKSLKKEAKEKFFISTFKDSNFSIWSAYLVGQAKILGIDSDMTFSNIQEVYKMYSQIKYLQWEIEAKTSLAYASTIAKAVTLGITYNFQTEYELRNLIRVKEYPVSEYQIEKYTELLILDNVNFEEIEKLVEEFKNKLTWYEGNAKIKELKEKLPCNEKQLTYIQGLEIRLGRPVTQSMTMDKATNYCNELKCMLALKLGAGFKTVEDLLKYAQEEAQAEAKTTKKQVYASQIIDKLIKGLEMDMKINYLNSEEVRSNLSERIANTIK